MPVKRPQGKPVPVGMEQEHVLPIDACTHQRVVSRTRLLYSARGPIPLIRDRKVLLLSSGSLRTAHR